MLDKQISGIIKKLQSSYGEAFFNRLTKQLHQVIGADYTFIARLNEQASSARTISLIAKGQIAENFEYDLKNTPCADVSDDNVCVYQNNICQLFPHDQLLIDMGIEGYVGSPLYDSSGKVMGLVVALFEQQIQDSSTITSLFSLFSGRIAAEIERSESEQQLRSLNQNLESKVSMRTAELSTALTKLRASQKKIIEHEKLASLGRLVSGLAHEINSPLGTALLTSSAIEQKVVQLLLMMHEQTLTRSQMENLLSEIQDGQKSLQANMRRAANLVESFKQISTEQHSNQRAEIELTSWLNTVISSVAPLMANNRIEIDAVLPAATITIESYPGQLAQVLTHLLTNVATHAYPDDVSFEQKSVSLSVSSQAKDVVITIADHGIGISQQMLEQVCEPFVTTKRGRGGAGLGLSIVSNLVRGSLEGELSLASQEGKGLTATLTLPHQLTSSGAQS